MTLKNPFSLLETAAARASCAQDNEYFADQILVGTVCSPVVFGPAVCTAGGAVAGGVQGHGTVRSGSRPVAHALQVYGSESGGRTCIGGGCERVEADCGGNKEETGPRGVAGASQDRRTRRCHQAAGRASQASWCIFVEGRWGRRLGGLHSIEHAGALISWQHLTRKLLVLLLVRSVILKYSCWLYAPSVMHDVVCTVDLHTYSPILVVNRIPRGGKTRTHGGPPRVLLDPRTNSRMPPRPFPP